MKDIQHMTDGEVLEDACRLARENIAATKDPQERSYWAGYANAMHAALLFHTKGRDPREDVRE